MTPAQLSGKTSFSFPPNIEVSFFDTRSGILHPLHVRGVYQAKGRPRRQKSRQGYGIGGAIATYGNARRSGGPAAAYSTNVSSAREEEMAVHESQARRLIV